MRFPRKGDDPGNNRQKVRVAVRGSERTAYFKPSAENSEVGTLHNWWGWKIGNVSDGIVTDRWGKKIGHIIVEDAPGATDGVTEKTAGKGDDPAHDRLHHKPLDGEPPVFDYRRPGFDVFTIVGAGSDAEMLQFLRALRLRGASESPLGAPGHGTLLERILRPYHDQGFAGRAGMPVFPGSGFSQVLDREGLSFVPSWFWPAHKGQAPDAGGSGEQPKQELPSHGDDNS